MIDHRAGHLSADNTSVALELPVDDVQAGNQISNHLGSHTNSQQLNAQSAQSSAQNIQIGARLKVVREQNGLSQRELAKRSSVTHSSISMIEQGQHSPSVSSLEKILSGIPMTLAQFFVFDPLNATQVVYRSSELAAQQKHNSAIIVQDIPHKNPQLSLIFQKIILSAGADMGAVPRISNHAISAIVIAGQLELTANMHVSALDVGDAFSLSVLQPYRLRNLSPTDECILLYCEA